MELPYFYTRKILKIHLFFNNNIINNKKKNANKLLFLVGRIRGKQTIY